jgi:hypothetical protein
MTDTELLRSRFRPGIVTLLLVGESPRAGGTFFYPENSNLYAYRRKAFLSAGLYNPDRGSFLDRFRDLGCYLVDLCPAPVDDLADAAREAARAAGRPTLVRKFQDLRPRAVVSTPITIGHHVREAMDLASLSRVVFCALRFPTFGHQQCYVKTLSRLLTQLSSEGIFQHAA